MEGQLVSGGNALDEKEKKLALERRNLQEELQAERIKQQAIYDEKLRADEMLLEKDAKYDNAQAEVDDQKKIIKKLRQKFNQAE